MNHSHQNQQNQSQQGLQNQQNSQNQQPQFQQQNPQQYSDQFLQSLLHSYLIQQQTQPQMQQQSVQHVTKMASLPTISNIPGMPTLVTPPSGTSYPNTIQLQQQQRGQPVVPTPPMSPLSLPVTPLPPVSLDNQLLDVEGAFVPKRKRSLTKIFAIALVIGLAAAIYFIWQGAPTSLSTSTTGVQNSTVSNGGSSGGSVGNVAGSSSGDIQVYVLGAIKTPGVYTLSSTARVLDLIKAAGGPLPKANLVALNMAAKLTDGEEVYVTMIGETPPTYMGGVPSLNGGNSTPVAPGGAGGTSGTSSTTGTATGQLININTASESDMMTNLHISSRTAQAIINYRTQNGNYTSVDQLLQVVSRSIYDKIRSQCTV
ncbi:MAG TPA: hypothetical protein DHW02_15425 [Ktedonobacter sp.]|nr:hypothetical protein [Ktedonobacter sp.]